MSKTIHQGRNVKRFREMLGIKQEGLAIELGEDWNQKKISLLEQRETIEQDTLDRVASVLKLPLDLFKNFDEESAINIIANTINNHDQSAVVHNHSVINPIEKWLEALDENRKLYERLLEAEREKVRMLEKFLDK